jgi:hypothetical protein
MIFTKKSYEGYLHVDHRASPGLPEAAARRAGYDPAFCGEGKVYEAATLGCVHCGAHVVKNPFRTRERGQCSKCGYRYVCDGCAAAMKDPFYVHRSIDEISDKLNSGRWALSGLMSNPNLTPRLTGD